MVMRNMNIDSHRGVFFAYSKEMGESLEGNRDMHSTAPFIIGGGTNTEKYYFLGINKFTTYNFSVKPEYFGNESRYYEVFPQQINKIIEGNPDAVVYCVFDYDTIFNGRTKLEHHKEFLKFIESIKQNCPTCRITLCPSMPSIEYWFLLHFENNITFMRNPGMVNSRLSNNMRDYFPRSTKSFGKTLKTEVYLKDLLWVGKLSGDGKLQFAIKNAEENIQKFVETDALETHSYSFVYKIFK